MIFEMTSDGPNVSKWLRGIVWVVEVAPTTVAGKLPLPVKLPLGAPRVDVTFTGAAFEVAVNTNPLNDPAGSVTVTVEFAAPAMTTTENVNVQLLALPICAPEKTKVVLAFGLINTGLPEQVVVGAGAVE